MGNAAFRLSDSVFKSVNQKTHVARFFCDLAKAFCCVTDEILSPTLYFYGIQEHLKNGSGPFN
jgi:hypothetical protein